MNQHGTLHPAEQALIDALRDNHPCDLGNLADAPKPEPENVIRAGLLRDLMVNPSAFFGPTANPFARGISIEVCGAWIEGDLTLATHLRDGISESADAFLPRIRFESCVLTGMLNLTGTHLRSLSLRGCKLAIIRAARCAHRRNIGSDQNLVP